MSREEELERELAIIKSDSPSASMYDIARGIWAREPTEFADPEVRRRAYRYVAMKQSVGEAPDPADVREYAMQIGRYAPNVDGAP